MVCVRVYGRECVYESVSEYCERNIVNYGSNLFLDSNFWFKEYLTECSKI